MRIHALKGRRAERSQRDLQLAYGTGPLVSEAATCRLVHCKQGMPWDARSLKRLSASCACACRDVAFAFQLTAAVEWDEEERMCMGGERVERKL